MKKSKFIQDYDDIKFKKQLREHMQLMNPKPSEEILEKLRQRYTKDREAHETNKNSDQ
jgi:hypothetical protein